jgi:hypothetical protein
VRERLINFCE